MTEPMLDDVADIEALKSWIEGLTGTWESYTPTISGWTLGNGTITGSKMDIGPLTFFTWTLTCGSTTSGDSGLIVSTPTTPIESVGQGVGRAVDVSGTGNSARRALAWVPAGITITKDDNAVQASTLWTLAAGDTVSLHGWYRRA